MAKKPAVESTPSTETPAEETSPADRIAELELKLEAAQTDAESMTARYNESVLDRGRARERIVELEGVLRSIAPGKVLEEDDQFETVVVRRRKLARPTGRFILKANVRCTISDKDHRNLLRSEGAALAEEGDEHVHMVTLSPSLDADGKPRAFSLPENVAKQCLASGAVVEEVR